MLARATKLLDGHSRSMHTLAKGISAWHGLESEFDIPILFVDLNKLQTTTNWKNKAVGASDPYDAFSKINTELPVILLWQCHHPLSGECHIFHRPL